MDAPTVTIAQTSKVSPVRSGSGAASSTAVPVDFRLEVANPLDHAVTLTSVEIETVGASGGYLMQRVRHRFAQLIPAHGKVSLDVRAWVQPLQETDRGQVVSAVMLRGTARFESNGNTIQTAFAGRLAEAGAVRW